mmetsp:Transcript_19729/g.35040  ORF Transcript_19729/g.35040 Transcript_19729/m.35040 type:complete len:82 (-) Transcript_19729:567-812(-)
MGPVEKALAEAEVRLQAPGGGSRPAPALASTPGVQKRRSKPAVQFQRTQQDARTVSLGTTTLILGQSELRLHCLLSRAMPL